MFILLYITPEDKNLNSQKAGGPDYIPTRLLKEFALELAPSLTLLFQASLE